MVSSTHMALRLISLLLLLLLALFASSQKSTVVSASPIGEGWGGLSSLYETTSPRKCNTEDGGLIGDCINEEEEMESETSRRVLAQTQRRFISYDALIKNKTPCNRRGHSYYNCVRSGKANPYRRPCTIITRCARILD